MAFQELLDKTEQSQDVTFPDGVLQVRLQLGLLRSDSGGWRHVREPIPERRHVRRGGAACLPPLHLLHQQALVKKPEHKLIVTQWFYETWDPSRASASFMKLRRAEENQGSESKLLIFNNQIFLLNYSGLH